jgi:hypothetical protein
VFLFSMLLSSIFHPDDNVHGHSGDKYYKTPSVMILQRETV